MSIYKKNINNIQSSRNMEYTMSNNLGIYMNQTVIGENISPYHGLFIKQEENRDEVYLSKIIEQIKIDGKVYSISDIKTNEETYGGSEYLEEFNRYPVPSFKYNIEGLVNFEKKYAFSLDQNILCINYDIENLTSTSVNLKILPLVTKRNLFTSKRESMLKLNSDRIPEGFKVTLSMLDKKCMYMQSKDFKVKEKAHYINGIRYDYAINSIDKKLYLDDLYVPGYFEYTVKANTKINIQIYVSCENIDLTDKSICFEKLYEQAIEKEKMVTLGIDENFFELKSLAISASHLNYIDTTNKKFILLKSLPNAVTKGEYLADVISSIYGNYVLLKKYKEAYRILESIKYRLEKEKVEYTKHQYYQTLFTYIEALNKYINSEGATTEEKSHFNLYIKEKIEEIINLEDKDKIYDNSFIITFDDKRYLLINIYWYNALKVYVNNIADSNMMSEIYNMAKSLKDNLIATFFDETNKVLKYEASDDAYASSDMLYAMDLSNPLIHDRIAMLVIDTAFKELYTPYGIRKFSVKSGKYDGYVYPHLMATFVNSNLRQNGVTRATQKIAFNLVKELLQEINKETVGTVKYKYDEKTKKAYGMPINSLTNSEIIRLYNMLI